MTQTTLIVPGISCAHCKQSIEDAVGNVAGVESVTVDIEPRAVHLVFDDQAVELVEIKAAIEDAGYEVPETPDA